MCINLLKLNVEKMDFIILGTQQQPQKISHINVQIGEDLVTPVDMVHNLGFHYGKYLKKKTTLTGSHLALTTHSENTSIQIIFG